MPLSLPYFLGLAPEQARLQQHALDTLLADADIERLWRHVCGHFRFITIAHEHLIEDDITRAFLEERYEHGLAQLLARIPDDHDLRRALGRYLREYLEAAIDHAIGYPSIGMMGQRFERFLGDEAAQRSAYERAITTEKKTNEDLIRGD